MPLSKAQAKLLAQNPAIGNTFTQGGWFIKTGVPVAVTPSAADLNQLTGVDALIDTGNTGASTTPNGTIEVDIGGVSVHLLTSATA